MAALILILAVAGGTTVFAHSLWRNWIQEGAEVASGLYLTNGGQSFLVIESESGNHLNVKEGKILTYDGRWPLYTIDSLRSHYKQGHLYLRQTESGMGFRSENQIDRQSVTSLELRPSETMPGDWDLVKANFAVNLNGEPPEWLMELASRYDFVDKWFWRVSNLLVPILTQTEMSMAAEDPPMRSFLHRIEDPNVLEYCHLRLQDKFTRDSMPFFRQIIANHPDDAYLRVHEIEVETVYGDIETARRIMGDWRDRLEKAPDVLLRRTAQRAFHRFASATEPGGDLEPEKVARLLSEEKTNLDGCVALFRSLWNLNHLVTTSRPIMEPRQADSSSCNVQPDFISIHSIARVITTLAQLDLLQGNNQESLDKMASVHAFGQSLSADGDLLERLIGQSFLQIALSRLNLIVLNASEDPADLQTYREVLDRLNRLSPERPREYPISGEWSNFLLELPDRRDDYEIAANALVLLDNADGAFLLTRMALGARHHFLTTGSFPQSAADLAPFFPDGLPADPFSDVPLRFTKPGVEPFAVYSVGPDKEDNLGQIEYSPTNGTYSAGDSILTIPKERKYPFPRGGVHAKNAQDVLAQFPNGLPLDLFAGNGNTPLSILDAANEGLVTILSFGPQSEDTFSNAKAYSLPGLQPVDTGISSIGDYQYVFTPSLGEAASVVSVTAVRVFPPGMMPFPFPPGAPPGDFEKMRELMENQMSAPRTIGPFQLGPRYNPTNGIGSAGQLYVDLPE